MSPVTHVALIDVNNASEKLIGTPSLEISGIIKRIVPKLIKTIKDNTKSLVGDIFLLFIDDPFFKM